MSNAITTEPKSRWRPLRRLLHWLLTRLAARATKATVKIATKSAVKSEAERVAHHERWQKYSREKDAEHVAEVRDLKDSIQRQASELEILKLERAKLLEVNERDRERVRAETAINSATIAKAIGGEQSQHAGQ